MPFVLIFVVLFTDYAHSADRDPASWLTGVQWLSESKQQVTRLSARRDFTSNQARHLLLPAYQWLTIPKQQLEQFTFSSGSSPFLYQILQNTDWRCDSKYCQLPAQDFNRIITVKHHTSNGQLSAEFFTGQFLHETKNEKAVALPLPFVELTTGTQVERAYLLAPNQVLDYPVAADTIVKVEVRKHFSTHASDTQVSIAVDNSKQALINVPDIKAFEYASPEVGIKNHTYITFERHSTLSISAPNSVYISIKLLERDRPLTVNESEIINEPSTWYPELKSILRDIYIHNNFSMLNQFNHEQSTSQERRKYLDLLDIISYKRTLTPNHSNGKIDSKSKQVSTHLGFRVVKKIVLPTISKQSLLFHQLNQTLTFDLNSEQRVNNALFALIRTTSTAKLVFTACGRHFSVYALGHVGFQAIRLPVPTTCQQISASAENGRDVALAIQIQALRKLPNANRLISIDNPSIKLLINELLHTITDNRAQAFRHSLQPIKPWLTTANTSTSHSKYDELHQLQVLQQQNKEDALTKLAPYLSSSYSEVQLQAWHLQDTWLRELGRAGSASKLLNTLLLQPKKQLQDYAATVLLENYLTERNLTRATELCAAIGNRLEACDTVQLQKLVVDGVLSEAHWRLATMTDENLTPIAEQVQAKRILQPPEWSLQHCGIVRVKQQGNDKHLYLLTKGQSIRLHAQTPVELNAKVRARLGAQSSPAWLYANIGEQLSLIPVETDLAANIETHDPTQRLSTATDTRFRLTQGQTVILFATQDLFLDLSFNSVEHAEVSQPNPRIPLLSELTFQTALFATEEVDELTLAVNGLYRLTSFTLTSSAYQQLIIKLVDVAANNQALNSAYTALKAYGHWVPINNYVDFSGTKRVSRKALMSESTNNKIMAHLTNQFHQGLSVPPEQKLNLQIPGASQNEMRLSIQFSNAKSLRPLPAHIKIGHARGLTNISVHEQQASYFNLTENVSDNEPLTIRWLNPLQNQRVTINIEQSRNGVWQSVMPEPEQLFYQASETNPVIATLSQPGLIRIERIENGISSESITTHPAGELLLTRQPDILVRASLWQMKEHYSKVPSTPVLPIFAQQLPSNKTALATTEKFYPVTQLSYPEQWMTQGQLTVREDNITQGIEPDRETKYAELGLIFRKQTHQRWYEVALGYASTSPQNDLLYLNGNVKWLDENSHWFAEFNNNNRFQQGTEQDNLLVSRFAIKLGQIAHYDSGYRVKWWWSPFTYYDNLKNTDTDTITQLNPRLFSVYRSRHLHGWRGATSFSHFGSSDTRVSTQLQVTSNEDWSSIDNAELTLAWQHYYKSHIVTAQFSASGSFSDDDRRASQRNTFTTLSWQKDFVISQDMLATVSLGWQRNWKNSSNDIKLQLVVGNTTHTSMTPYAHDELAFERQRLRDMARAINDAE
ncbi:hypothetical protein ACSLBF_12535 [Pseudoalteromonas sp. T1lg65]|uniref:hypothetical protein n=1 Tax=Pseudoalteromonas sp. T1lg65 TaxID=2077101 RepID=UPI003F7A889A